MVAQGGMHYRNGLVVAVRKGTGAGLLGSPEKSVEAIPVV